MVRDVFLPMLMAILGTITLKAQTVELHGRVLAPSNIEGIHVINKTSGFFATTTQFGGFTIRAKLNDTLVFSAIQYKITSVLVKQENIDSQTISVELEELINQLDEVFIRPSLTGNLEDDILLSKAQPPINFYDVGIPGYQGPPKTKRERELYEATSGLGLIPLNPILNAISGRTKKLKQRVKLERRDALMFKIKAKFSKDLFHGTDLQEEQKMDFFYFCSEDTNFETICGSDYDLRVLQFLKDKLAAYKLNLTKSN